MDKQAILYWGVGAALAAYLLVKIVGWIRKSRASRVPAAKAPVAKRPDPARAPLQVFAAPPESATPPRVEPPRVEPSTSRAAAFWPREPNSVKQGNLFEDVGVEYPYATEDDYAFGGLTPAMAALVPSSDDSRRQMTKSLRNAGYYSPHAWQNYSAVRYLGLVLPLVLFGALLLVVPPRLEPAVMIGLIVGPALGWALPALIVRSRATERLREIEVAMPDMLDLLNMCVSQGMTVPSALGRVSKEIQPVYPALSKELHIVTEQARVGSLSQALTNFGSRVDVPEVNSFSSLLIQTEQMGTSVSSALADYSDGMRESMRQRSDEKANSATFKLLFPTVLCLMPAVMLFLMGPSVIEMDRFFQNGGMDGVNRAVSSPFESTNR